jgi:His-Xaa-Ser system radical SAM maturase HxsC
MALKLTISGRPISLSTELVGRIEASADIPDERKRDGILLVPGTGDGTFHPTNAKGFAAAIFENSLDDGQISRMPVPVVHAYRDLGHLKPGYIVAIRGDNGFTRTIYRPDSRFNTIFTTDRCNSNCLMCSQPPKDEDDSYLVARNLRMLDLIEEPPEMMGITGGEPTLLKDDLIRMLSALKEKLPGTYVHMLTNGRLYSYPEFVANVADVGHPAFTSAIPLYADVAQVHDYVVQAEGAFDQTVEGIYNAAAAGLNLEIRVVLHKQTIPRLQQLVEFIYRSFPFVGHVALMGLENMGYVKKNWETLWIDPVDYMETLKHAIAFLWHSRVPVSIYNLQLCLLPPSLWAFARQSISDFKNIYLGPCTECEVRERCAGLFSSSQNRHSAHIRPLRMAEVNAL